jgi:two-component system cell cycle sensor histidine kinase/response regulator CckA
MHTAKLQRIGLVAIAAALVTLATTGVMRLNDWRTIENTKLEIQRSRNVLDLTERLRAHITDAETGQRGFLLTGRQEYLAPYQSALAVLPDDIETLTTLSKEKSNERSEFLQLKPAINDKLAELGRTIELRQYQGIGPALAVIETDEGENAMQRIRALIRRVGEAETARSRAAWRNVDILSRHLQIVTFVGVAILAILVMVGIGAFRKSAAQLENLVLASIALKQSVEENRDLLEATLYSIGDGVITTDGEGGIRMMNEVAERLTGYEEGEASGQGIEQVFRIVNETSRTALENPVRRVLRDGLVAGLANHTVLIHRSGGEVPIDDSAAPIAGPTGHANGTVLVFRDVSVRKEAGELARRLATIVQSTDDAIVSNSLDGIVTSWNRGAEKLFGYSAEEMIGSPITRLIPPGHTNDVVETLHRIGQGESVKHHQTERLTKDGGLITASLTVSPLRDENGRVVGASTIARDITRQRQLEERVAQTQKIEAVGLLAGGIAHDFNNLITVILGYAAMAKARLGSGDPLRKSLTEIVRAAERAASLTGQLLTFSRKQITKPTILDLHDWVASTEDMLQRLIGERILLAVTRDPGPCTIRIDSGHLTQILMNLTINARDAMSTGGRLNITTSTVFRGQTDLGPQGIHPSGLYALLSVMDTGEGIESEAVAHLFEPFFTTKEPGKGTGLGLATVYGIVTQANGWIEVCSKPGDGATFSVYFPLADGQLVEAIQERALAATNRVATILLVEDQEGVRLLLEDLLGEAGHRIISAANGRAALDLAVKHEDPIDLLITDVIMPEMNGPHLADQLKRARPDLIVVFISGYPDDAFSRHQVFEQGTFFIQKPFQPEVLLDKVSEILQEKSMKASSGT